jgi:GNAT superfamily N-acetyltransferase
MRRVEPLDERHDRASFSSGVPALDDFLQRFARQNQDRGLSRTFVLTSGNSSEVLGYYTLRAGALLPGDLPEAARKKLPRYPVPVAHLARLAVDERVRGQGLGSMLLVDALEQIVSVARQVGIYAVEVLAKDDRARAFYAHHGFSPLVDDPNHLYVSLREVRASLGATTP